MNDPLSAPRRRRLLVAYGGMVVATLAVFLWVRQRGEGLAAGLPAAHASAPAAKADQGVFLHVLFALAVITLFARFLGGAFRRTLRQPPVMGEIVAGLLLGPSVLGALWPEAQAFLLPAAAEPYLGMIARLGVVLFLFLVGLELDPRLLRTRPEATLAISHASILAPLALGSLLALWLYPRHATSDVPFTVFALFTGVSLSVTAFPVLARILHDRGVQGTLIGATALACAAVDDVTAWVLLALLAGIARAHVDGAAWTVLFLLLYVGAMLFVVRPLLRPWVEREQRAQGPLSHTALALVLAGLLFSAVATEAIGVHALFGAFLLGAILPHEGRLPREIHARLSDVVLVLLLPSFFVVTGMRTRVDLLGSSEHWLACGLIVLVATLGKFGGSALAARLSGFPWRSATAIGLLMNTRGLMELIVLSVGLELGVITPVLFTMLVLMALVTTFTATPVLDLVLGRGGLGATAVEPEPRS